MHNYRYVKLEHCGNCGHWVVREGWDEDVKQGKTEVPPWTCELDTTIQCRVPRIGRDLELNGDIYYICDAWTAR